MGSVDRSGFSPLDLEIIDRVYEAAWAHVLARSPGLTSEEEPERKENLRKRLFALTHPGRVDFDILYDLVVSSYDNPVQDVRRDELEPRSHT
jgi:hypothetical protein